MLTAELKSVMSSILKKASAMSMAAYALMLVFSATGSGAAAQEKILTAGQSEAVSEDVQPAASLADLVAAEPETKDLSEDLSCLASAIYFESRNEPLDGQLAVARVIVNRSKSGRFPDSYCGVVKQASQFSFVHHNKLPDVKTGSPNWRKAVAVARIAHEGRWKNASEGALYFHATRVSPRWRKAVAMARIENHVFYR